MDAAIENLFSSAENLELQAWGLKRLAEESSSSNTAPDRVLAHWRQVGTIPGLKLRNAVRRTAGDSDEAFHAFLQQLERRLQDSTSASSETVCETESVCSQDASLEDDCEESAYDLAVRRGIIGMFKDGPSDLSSNPKHMEGFGE